MTGGFLSKGWRTASAIATAVALALPAQASSPASASAGAVEAAAVEKDFGEVFEVFEELPDTPEPTGVAVDLDTFEPPLEPKPEPEAVATRSLGTGVASYYGRRFHGRLTANGERFNMRAMTAAHKTLPFGTRVRVTNTRTGRSVIVRINDRGPFIRGRTIDLSRGAAEKIGLIKTGHARVKIEVVES